MQTQNIQDQGWCSSFSVIWDAIWFSIVNLFGKYVVYFSSRPDIFSNSSITVMALATLCLSGLFALSIGRLVYAFIMMLARQKLAANMITEQTRWVDTLQSEKRDLMEKLGILKREFVAAKGQVM